MPAHKGLIIYFDGPDGAGKTTQLNLAAEALKKAGHEVVVTRTMGGTPIGEMLREAMLTETNRPTETDLHIAVATQYALADEVTKHRDKGHIVLIDRSPLSIIGYQVYGDGLDADMGREAVDDLLDLFGPNLLIIYQADAKILSKRREIRNKEVQVDYFENKPHDYHKKVAEGFKVAADQFGATVIKADGSIQAVHESTMAKINGLL